MRVTEGKSHRLNACLWGNSQVKGPHFDRTLESFLKAPKGQFRRDGFAGERNSQVMIQRTTADLFAIVLCFFVWTHNRICITNV